MACAGAEGGGGGGGSGELDLSITSASICFPRYPSSLAKNAVMSLRRYKDCLASALDTCHHRCACACNKSIKKYNNNIIILKNYYYYYYIFINKIIIIISIII